MARAEGLTLDTGALIAFERGDAVTAIRIERAALDGVRVTVPAPCIVEAWRGGPRSARLARLMAGVSFEALDLQLARAAGVLLVRAGSDDAVDAVVIAGAHRRGDAVLTGDPKDLELLAEAAGGRVAVLAVS